MSYETIYSESSNNYQFSEGSVEGSEDTDKPRKVEESEKKSDKQFKLLLFSTVGDYNDTSANFNTTEDEETVADEKAVALSENKVEKIVLRIKNTKS